MSHRERYTNAAPIAWSGEVPPTNERTASNSGATLVAVLAVALPGLALLAWLFL